jgi:hypothetical protein
MAQLQADGLAIVGSNLADRINAARIQILGDLSLNVSKVDGKVA